MDPGSEDNLYGRTKLLKTAVLETLSLESLCYAARLFTGERCVAADFRLERLHINVRLPGESRQVENTG